MKIFKNIYLIAACGVFFGIQAQSIIEKKWTVVGAGPGGLTAIGLLLDNNVDPQSIAWVDHEFNGGRFTRFQHIPGNTKVGRVMTAFNSCKAFDHGPCTCLDLLKKANPDRCCPLKHMHIPFVCITKHLRTKVDSFMDHVSYLKQQGSTWMLHMNNAVIKTENVILASGSHPKNLSYEKPQSIPLEDCFNPELLQQHVTKDDVVGVFGGADSAMLAVKNLHDVGVKSIINFYRTPIRFKSFLRKRLSQFTNTRGEPLRLEFADEGLGNGIAEWAVEHVMLNPLDNLMRVKSDNATVKEYLPLCTKVVYGVGYDRDDIPTDNPDIYNAFDYETGIIAPGLFGMGIAFPGKGLAASGKLVPQVGLPSFMKQGLRVIPQWIKSRKTRLAKKRTKKQTVEECSESC